MKKSLTRVLSLVLVLVMMLGVLPMASAEENPVSVADATATWNEAGTAATATLTANVGSLEGYTAGTPQWSLVGAYLDATINGGSFSAKNEGRYTVKVTVVYTSNDAPATGPVEATDTSTYEATCTVTVPANPTAVTGVTLSKSAHTMKVNDSVTLTATVAPENAKNKEVTWSSSAPAIATVDQTGKVEAKAKGTAVITAASKADATKKAECTVKVTDETYTVDVTPATLTLVPSGSSTLNVVVKDSSGETVTTVAGELIWSVDPTDKKVSVDASGKVTAADAKVGDTVTVTAAYTKDGTSYTDTCAVTIGSGTITVSNKENELNALGAGSYALSGLNPVCDINGDGLSDNDKVTFKYEEIQKVGAVALNDAKDTLTATGPGAMALRVSAYDKNDPTSKLAETIVYVSFYVTNTVEATMPSGKTTLTFGTAADIKETGNLSSLILKGYADSTAYKVGHYVTFSGLTRTEGTLDVVGNSLAVANLGNVKFTVGTSGRAVFEAAVTADAYGKLALCKAVITIKYDGELGDIEYSTTYNKAITFDEADFAKFWKASGQTSALNYVSFNLLSYPAYGDLYLTATSTTTANKALSSHRFYYNYNSRTDAGSANKDLATLTYVPVSTMLSTYDVTIPFTAYGEDAKEYVSGTVVIHMNPNDNNITSRGVFFGTTYDNKGTTTTADDLTYADQLAEIYKTATGKELGYVVFTLPAAERATLYSRVPVSGRNYQIARGTTLLYGTKLYYHGTSSVAADLDDVAVIPAAGFSGPLTLSFTGYDAAGNNEKACTITFNVQTRTASAVFTDVTAKGYSWAADSVDFLYYEGTAQGSNGKYNPAANITRRDFMLMLYRAFLEQDYGTYSVSSNFPDVKLGNDAYSKEIYQAVGVAKYLGIAQGTNNKFNPTSNITRQEAMVLIYRTLEVINKDLRTSSGIKATSFKDYSKIGSWATTAISSLVSHGVIQGTNDYINPLSNITRAEMACILHRVITY